MDVTNDKILYKKCKRLSINQVCDQILKDALSNTDLDRFRSKSTKYLKQRCILIYFLNKWKSEMVHYLSQILLSMLIIVQISPYSICTKVLSVKSDSRCYHVLMVIGVKTPQNQKK